MEPFGLFQFLQTLLSPQGPSEESSDAVSPTQPTLSLTKEEAFTSTTTQNAAAKFLENHERRAGRKR